MSVVEAIDLHRTFRFTTGTFRRRRKRVEAVRGISFAIERGELFGLLGPNGAGKTTTIKILVTLLAPTAGCARVMGHDVEHDVQSVRRNVGFVLGGERGLYDRLSGEDNLRYFGELYGVRNARRRAAELLEIVGLTERGGERVERYSRGMHQRLHIARGLLHDPPVLFLDEPTIGLDPQAARDVRALLAELAGAGRTLLLTTHYLHEADELCDRLAVIDGGRIVAAGTPEELKVGVAAGWVIEVEAEGAGDEVLAGLRALDGVLDVEADGDVVRLRCSEGEALTPTAIARMGGVVGLVALGYFERTARQRGTLELA